MYLGFVSKSQLLDEDLQSAKLLTLDMALSFLAVIDCSTTNMACVHSEWCKVNLNGGGAPEEACVQGEEYVELSGGGRSDGAHRHAATFYIEKTK